MIQKRLLNRFKDKNPSPLNNLDFLLNHTYDQIIEMAMKVEQEADSIDPVVSSRRRGLGRGRPWQQIKRDVDRICSTDNPRLASKAGRRALRRLLLTFDARNTQP